MIDKAWSRRLVHTYGISAVDYNKMFRDQNGVCAICERPPVDIRLAVDHNHASGRVRGLLCNPCNLVLGMMDDKHERLLKAYQYLKKNNELDIDWDLDNLKRKLEACGIEPLR